MKKSFDILTCSKAVRMIILKRIKELQVSSYLLCVKNKVYIKTFHAFMRTFNPELTGVKASRMTQRNIIDILNDLGINIQIVLEIDNSKVDFSQIKSNKVLKVTNEIQKNKFDEDIYKIIDNELSKS